MSCKYFDIKVLSYNSASVEKAALIIIRMVSGFGNLTVRGPIPIPVKRKCFVVNKSPHVNKSSREHFVLAVHGRLIRAEYYDKFDRKLVVSLSEVELPSGVDVCIKSFNDVGIKSVD